VFGLGAAAHQHRQRAEQGDQNLPQQQWLSMKIRFGAEELHYVALRKKP
jgi:hypothetical protein